MPVPELRISELRERLARLPGPLQTPVETNTIYRELLGFAPPCDASSSGDGHIAGVINPASKNKCSCWTGSKQGDNAEPYKDTRWLVDALDEVLVAACGQGRAGAAQAGQLQVPGNRAGTGPLRQGSSRGDDMSPRPAAP